MPTWACCANLPFLSGYIASPFSGYRHHWQPACIGQYAIAGVLPVVSRESPAAGKALKPGNGTNEDTRRGRRPGSEAGFSSFLLLAVIRGSVRALVRTGPWI